MRNIFFPHYLSGEPIMYRSSMDLPAKSLSPNSLTDADIATNIVVHALKQGRGKSRKTKNG